MAESAQQAVSTAAPRNVTPRPIEDKPERIPAQSVVTGWELREANGGDQRGAGGDPGQVGY